VGGRDRGHRYDHP